MSIYRETSLNFGPPPDGIVRRLIIITSGIFLFQTLLGFSGAGRSVEVMFGLVPDLALKKLYIWQYVTYLFLHGGLFHILFNMLCLWWFGSSVETALGSRKFLRFYLVCGAGAGLIVSLLSLFTVSHIPVVGASGAIFGLLAAYGSLFPNNTILVFFLFPMRAKYAVLLFGLIELYAVVTSYGYQLGSLAHISGMGLGYLYCRKGGDLDLVFNKGKETIKRRKEEKTRKQVRKRANFYKEEIDPILDKISSQGMDSLTPEERKKLEQARHFRAQ